MIPTITRFIKGRLKGQPKVQARRVPGLKDLQKIRSALLKCVQDCHGTPALRLRHKIEHTLTPQELWMLRNDAFQLISQQNSQQVAAERINELMSVFEGWLEPGQLLRIK